MNVVVYRRAPSTDSSRTVCVQPVFEKGASATDNSLIGAGRSLVVENNYGYTGPTSTQDGKTTAPGLERVDLDADGTGCRSVWRSQEVAPTVVPKLSAANGIVYTYTKDPQPRRPGRVVPDRAGLPHRQDALQAPRRRGARPQQQLRADHARARRHRLRRRARRPDRPARRDAAARRAGGAPAGAGRHAAATASLRLRVRRLQGRPRCGCGSSARASGRCGASRSACAASGSAWTASGRSARPSRASGCSARGRTKVVARIVRKDGTRAKRVQARPRR